MLVDIGWPGTMAAMQANLRRKGVPLNEIRYALATHFHIDHAGLAEEFKNAGVPLLVLQAQIAAIPLMNVTISFAESRETLARVGIYGEILHTPGHSDDSASLLLDDSCVFTGDLPPLAMAVDHEAVATSWRLLREHGATRVYPGHGPVRSITD